MSFTSRPVFLSKGVTCVCFISAGTVVDFNDTLMIFASNGAIILMFVINSVVGQGSRAQYFEGHLFTSRTVAVAVVGVNVDRVQWWWGLLSIGSTGSGAS